MTDDDVIAMLPKGACRYCTGTHDHDTQTEDACARRGRYERVLSVAGERWWHSSRQRWVTMTAGYYFHLLFTESELEARAFVIGPDTGV